MPFEVSWVRCPPEVKRLLESFLAEISGTDRPKSIAVPNRVVKDD
jgi:hypothetical protein